MRSEARGRPPDTRYTGGLSAGFCPKGLLLGSAGSRWADFGGPKFEHLSLKMFPARPGKHKQSAHERALELVSGADFSEQPARLFEPDLFPGPAVGPGGPKNRPSNQAPDLPFIVPEVRPGHLHSQPTPKEAINRASS